jgi:outer membrane autotransporter protein
LSGAAFGGSVGIDGVASDLPLLLGAAVTLSSSSLSADDQNASVTTNFGGASLYGVATAGAAYVSAIATMGYAHAGFDRSLFNLSFSADTGFDGTMFGGRVEAGYRLALAGIGANLTPFAAFQPMGLWLGGGAETFGILGRGLSYEASTVTALPTFLGLQLDGVWTASDGRLYTPYLRAAWMHDFSPDRDVSRAFAELPWATFSSTTIPTVRDAADVHAGIQFLAGPNMTLSAGLDGQIAQGYSTVGASGALRIRW